MLEKALISAVVHQRRGDRVPRRGDDAGAALRRARRRERQRRHDPADARRRGRLLGAASRITRRAARALDGARRELEARDDLGKVVVIGAGMKSHPGVAAKTFATLEREGIDAGGRLDVADQDRLPRRRRRRWSAPSGRCTRRSSLAEPPRIGVVGATGAVGTVTLELLRARGYEDVRVFASARSAGTTLDGRTRRGGDARGARCGRRRPLPLLGRDVGDRSSSSPTPCAAARSRSTSRLPTGSSRACRSSCRR